MGDFVRLDVDDGIATLTLNRPDVGNALNRALVEDLQASLDIILADDRVDVVIITGAGRMFCTGEDLKGLADPGAILPQAVLATEAVETIRLLPMPTIAAINGYAVAGGMEILYGCDLRIAASGARFVDNHCRMGIPGGGSTQLLPKLIGMAKAKEMLFTGEFITADDALQAGFLNRVVSIERLLDEARELARRIQSNDRELVREIKRLINEGMRVDMTLERASSFTALLKKHDDLGQRATKVRVRNKAHN